MESLGGPSLLIEKQRQAAILAAKDTTPVPAVPNEYIEKFGSGYPVDFGFSLHQTVDNDPLRFYTYIVKWLLDGTRVISCQTKYLAGKLQAIPAKYLVPINLATSFLFEGG